MPKFKNFFAEALRPRTMPNFSRGRYEIALSIFSIFSFFFLKDFHGQTYYSLLVSMAAFLFLNLVFNFLLKEKSEVDIRFYFLTNAVNCLAISFVMNYSGGKDSYLWFLHLLPVMAMALSGEFFYSYILLFISFGCISLFYIFDFSGDFRDYFSLLLKGSVLAASCAFIRHSAAARKALEAELAFKRKQAEMLLAEASRVSSKKEQPNLEAEKSDFTAVAIHDLKNLISVIYIISQVINKDENFNKKEAERLLSAASYAAKLSKYALSAKKEYSFSPQKIDLGDFISETCRLMEYKFSSKKIKLDNNVENGKFFINADRLSLQRSLANILLNSFLVLPEGGEVSIRAGAANGKVKFEICDNGPGFPPQILDGIKPYNTGRIKEGGTGLGLYSVLKEVAKNGGEFRIYNGAEGGACCELTFPAA